MEGKEESGSTGSSAEHPTVRGVRRRIGAGTSSSNSLPQRQASNSMDHRVLSLKERILNDTFNMYCDKDVGLVKFGKLVDVDLPYPRRKVTVLILGNHSAGKSSFINWYIEETILKTGVAIETQGFAFVTSGKKRETLKGQATLQLYPHLKPLQQKPGVMEYLTTEISTSRSRRFNLVTFVDTPGLVDGDMNYPFDVNNTLLWLGDMADLIFVFFDPMGQALCKRTINIVENLWARNSEKIRLYLAKADEAGSETDRQKVLMQIVQELCKRPGLNRTGFDMPTIFLPEISGKASKCANQLNEVNEVIDKTIDQMVQKSLNNLEQDTAILYEKVKSSVKLDQEAKKRNWNKFLLSGIFGVMGMILPLLLFSILIFANSTLPSLRKHIGSAADVLYYFQEPLITIWKTIPQSYHLQIVLGVICVSAACMLLPRLFPKESVLPRRDSQQLNLALTVIEACRAKQKQMYAEFLMESVSESDFIG